MQEERKVLGSFSRVFFFLKSRISRNVKSAMYEKVRIMYGSETWTVNLEEKGKVKVFEILSPKNICGKRRSDRMRNSSIRERCRCYLSNETK